MAGVLPARRLAVPRPAVRRFVRTWTREGRDGGRDVCESAARTGAVVLYVRRHYRDVQDARACPARIRRPPRVGVQGGGVRARSRLAGALQREHSSEPPQWRAALPRSPFFERAAVSFPAPPESW